MSAKPASVPQDNRLHARVHAILPVTVRTEDGKTYRGEIGDISEGGAQLKCHADLAKEQRIQIEMRFSRLRTGFGLVVEPEHITDAGLISAVEIAEVRWAQAKNLYGIRFLNLSSKTRHFLKGLVKYFEKLKKDMKELE